MTDDDYKPSEVFEDFCKKERIPNDLYTILRVNIDVESNVICKSIKDQSLKLSVCDALERITINSYSNGVLGGMKRYKEHESKEDRELKSCPFCGSSDVHFEYEDDDEKRRIHCFKCGLSVTDPWWIQSVESLTRMFNRRANE